MESSKAKTSRTPSSTGQNSVSGGSGDHSPQLSVGSDMSRSGLKTSSSVSSDPKPSLVLRKPKPSSDFPVSPLPSPSVSLRNSCKHVAGIRISSQESSPSERYDSNSESVDKSDDIPETPMIGSSPYLPSSAKLRSCDVYIGVPSSKPYILKFAKWLRAELEMSGVSCFAADRSKCMDSVGHTVVERAMDSATYGVVIVSRKSFSNPYSMYELTSFLSRKNLVPIFFDLGPSDCVARDIAGRRGELWEKSGGELWNSYGGTEREWKEAVNALSRMDGWKLEARHDTWRDCISEATILLGKKLGRRSMVERVERWMNSAKREFPFPRNDRFVGRKRELLELELLLFGDLIENGKNECFELENVHRGKNAAHGRKSKSSNVVGKKNGAQSRGKEPVIWKDSDADIEMETSKTPQNHHQLVTGEHERRATRASYGKGIACVSGERGIGKTEVVLEFAYRFAQRYRMVLWIGGEARYIRQNYINLMNLLEIDASIENHLSFENNTPRNFEELEGEAIRRLRKEFMRDIPFLVLIDNLETEADWWDAKSIMDLLPRFGGETHIIISTRLPRVMNLEPLKLSYLSAAESMSLMKGRLHDIPAEEVGALRVIEEKLRRHTFGLALVGGILSENPKGSKHPISPQELLDAIDQTPDTNVIGAGDPLFKHNPFLVRLIEFCFLMFDQVDKLASKMALASGWFAPSPIPVSLLALSSSEALEKHPKGNIWKKSVGKATCRLLMFQRKRSEEVSSNALVRLGFARAVTKQGYIQFHEIIKLYARKKGGIGVAYAMVRAINAKREFPEHSEHVWAACFLLFKFGADPAILKPKASELVSFVRHLAAPLAASTFTNSRCNAALELLRLCTNALEDVDDPLLDERTKKSSWWGNSYKPTKEFNPRLFQESVSLKATLLEKRASLMLNGGDHEIGQQLCRKSITVREVLYGCDHPETLSACDTLNKLLGSQENT